jgi:hypothetical protein
MRDGQICEHHCGWTSLFIRAVLLVGWAASAQAAEQFYRCTILSAQTLSEQGSLYPPHWLKLEVGKTFSIDRRSGVVVGALFASGQGARFTVLARGSPGFSFSALWVDQRPLTTLGGFIQVQEFHDGEAKPFLVVDGNGSEVYTGTCE